MAKEHDPFAEFIVSSPVIDQFNKWSEPKATQSDDDFAQANKLEQVQPEGELEQIVRNPCQFPEGSLIIVTGGVRDIVLDSFLGGLGCDMATDTIEFDHHDNLGRLEIKGRCYLRTWQKDGQVVATDYRYTAKVGSADDGYRQVGYLAVRVAKEVLNGKNLSEINTFR